MLGANILGKRIVATNERIATVEYGARQPKETRKGRKDFERQKTGDHKPSKRAPGVREIRVICGLATSRRPEEKTSQIAERTV